VTLKANRITVVLFGIGLLAFFTSIILPYLRRDSEVRCPRSLKQIGSALLLYALDHGHRYPPSLDALFSDSKTGLEAATFKCPGDPEKGVSAYVYVGRGMTESELPETIVAYDANHEEGMYVLYGDGHVNFLGPTEGKHALAELAAGHNPPKDPTPTPTPATNPSVTGEHP
jgi:hypothetical protein